MSGNASPPIALIKEADVSPKAEPTPISKPQAVKWVQNIIGQTRGKELVGDLNPLLIGELFWEQSSNWRPLAADHVEEVAKVCETFLQDLLDDKCPNDIKSRLWSHRILDALKVRRNASFRELDLIIEDAKGFPINYNHYYTDTIHKRRLERHKTSLAAPLESATQHTHISGCTSNHTSASIDVEQVITSFSAHVGPDMEKISCEEALDRLFAIYKVSLPAHPPVHIYLTTTAGFTKDFCCKYNYPSRRAPYRARPRGDPFSSSR
jgi:hypothetical protein